MEDLYIGIVWKPLRKPQKDIPIPFSYFFREPLAYLKIPINDPVDESNFSFLIPILTCAPFLGFSCYLIRRGARVPRAVF